MGSRISCSLTFRDCGTTGGPTQVSCWVKDIVSTTCITHAGKTSCSAEGRLQSADDLKGKRRREAAELHATSPFGQCDDAHALPATSSDHRRRQYSAAAAAAAHVVPATCAALRCGWQSCCAELGRSDCENSNLSAQVQPRAAQVAPSGARLGTPWSPPVCEDDRHAHDGMPAIAYELALSQGKLGGCHCNAVCACPHERLSSRGRSPSMRSRTSRGKS